MLQDKKLKVLVTGGGTKVKIDDVRYIGNMASGSFPCKIVEKFLDMGDKALFLISEGGVRPFVKPIDLKKAYFNHYKGQLVATLDSETLRAHSRAATFGHNYREKLYNTYEEYENELFLSLTESPDIVFLGAAVSDYSPVPVAGKISSDVDDLSITLKRNKKLISEIKKRCPETTLVGFKLLYDVSDNELIAAAKKSIELNDCDLVIANDYKKIQDGNRELILVYKAQGVISTLGIEKLSHENNKVDRIYEVALCLFKSKKLLKTLLKSNE